jgi:hypothetical protein
MIRSELNCYVVAEASFTYEFKAVDDTALLSKYPFVTTSYDSTGAYGCLKNLPPGKTMSLSYITYDYDTDTVALPLIMSPLVMNSLSSSVNPVLDNVVYILVGTIVLIVAVGLNFINAVPVLSWIPNSVVF